MKNRMTGFCRLHRGNLGLISARSLQAAEPGSGLSLSIWQDQTKAVSNNSEKVPLMSPKKQEGHGVIERQMRCLFFFPLVSKVVFLFPFYFFFNSEIPSALIFSSLQPSKPYLLSLSKVNAIFQWHRLSANMLRRTWEYLVAFVSFFVAVRELCNKAIDWHAQMCISLW